MDGGEEIYRGLVVSGGLAPLLPELDPGALELRGAPLTMETFGIVRADFFDAATVWPFERRGWIITNPPFVPAARLLAKALAMEGVDGVALLLRLQWLTGQERWREIFARTPPTVVAPFVERVPMVLGGYDPAASTATDYAWFIWDLTPAPAGLDRRDRQTAVRLRLSTYPATPGAAHQARRSRTCAAWSRRRR